MSNKSLWKPRFIDKFIQDYLSGDKYDDLSKKHGGTYDQVKKFLSFLRVTEGLPSAKDVKEGITTEFEYKGTKIRQDFNNYLKVARTRRQIENIFGDETDELLKTNYNGYELFENINNFGDKVYILIPKISRDNYEVEDKIWKYHVPIVNKIKQPYLLVNMPDDVFDYNNELIIAPIADAHIGHYAHKKEKFQAYIQWIYDNPNVYAVIVGDLQENALDDGRGMTYSQAENPEEQIDECCRLLAPIAHKIFFIQPGNHELRTYKKAGIDPAQIIADYLKIPYFSGPIYMSLISGDNKWKFYSFHGNTNSQTKGGKMNAAGRARRFTDFVHFYLYAHVHDPLINNETCIVEDAANNCLRYDTQWTVICPSFMRWEDTYAYVAGYPPPGKGGVALHLYKDGRYKASLEDN